MAHLVLVTGTDPHALLADAARDYLAPPLATSDPFAAPATMLVLRQGGLRDDLLRMASARGVAGWFDPEIRVFAELAQVLHPTLLPALDAIERTVIIEEVLRHRAPQILGRPDRLSLTVREADALFGEFAAEGIMPDRFRAACEAHAHRDAFQERRDAEIAAAWEGYRAALVDAGRRDGRDALAAAAGALAHDADQLARVLGARRTLHIVGLMDLRGGWRALLRVLRANTTLERVAVYTMHADLFSADSDITPDAHESVGDQTTMARALFAAGAEPPATVAPQLRVLESPDPRREIERVAVDVRALVDGGVPPHRIAVVAREARPFVDRMAPALARMGVPVTTRQRVSLAEVPVVRIVRQLLEAAAEGWSRHALVELAEHPYGAGQLDPLVINRLGFERRVDGLAGWRSAHATLLARATARDTGAAPRDEDERRHPLPATARVTDAQAGIQRFAAFASALDGERSLSDWLAWLDGFLTDDPWTLEQHARKAAVDDLTSARADIRGWTLLRQAVRSWRAVVTRHAPPDLIDAAGFLPLCDAVLTGDIVLASPTVHGVVVAEALAAAYRGFDHVFVLGLEAGHFPRRRPVGIVLDDEERDALVAAGLPLDRRTAWEERERELFRSLVASARSSLVLSWSREDDAQCATVVSSFFEEATRLGGSIVADRMRASTVIVPAYPLAPHRAAVARGAHGAAIERARLTGSGGAYDGEIEHVDIRAWLATQHGESYTWSPTSLEGLAKCPHAWFAQRLLKLERVEEPDDDVAATVRGKVLHDALARFFDRLRAEQARPVFLQTADLAGVRDTLRAAFDAAYEAEAAGTWMGAPGLEGARRAEWLRTLTAYIEAEAEEHDKWVTGKSWQSRRPLHAGADRHEVAFGPMTLAVGDVRFRAHGRIDRVDVVTDDRIPQPGRWRVIVDYKSSTGAAPGGGKSGAFADGIVLQAPLYAMALQHLEPGIEIARIEYRSLRTGKAVLPINLAEVHHKTKVLDTELGGHADFAASRDAIPRTIVRARTGPFPPTPAESHHCPSWCVALDSCRIVGGPKTGEW